MQLVLTVKHQLKLAVRQTQWLGESRVAVEPRQASPCGPVEGGKLARDEDFAVVLQRDGSDRIIRAERRIGCRIECAVRVEPSESISGHPVVPSKITANENFAVGLERDGIDGGAKSDSLAGIEAHVRR